MTYNTAASAEPGVLHELVVGALGGALGSLLLGTSNPRADVWLADDGHGRGDGHQGEEEDDKGTHAWLRVIWVWVTLKITGDCW